MVAVHHTTLKKALRSKQIYRKRRVCKSREKKYGYKLACSGKIVQGKKLAEGKFLSGKDCLTIMIIRIDAIQNFYGRAIRDNKGKFPKKCRKKYGLFWTTTQAQKVILNVINIQRKKLVVVPERSSDWFKYLYSHKSTSTTRYS